jgi:hypothetical protein
VGCQVLEWWEHCWWGSWREDTGTPIARLTLTGVTWTWSCWCSVCCGNLEGDWALVPDWWQRWHWRILMRADLIVIFWIQTVASCTVLAQGVATQIPTWVITLNGRTGHVAVGSLIVTGR